MRIVFLDRSTIGPAVTMSKPSFPHEWIEHDRTPARSGGRAADRRRHRGLQQGADPRRRHHAVAGSEDDLHCRRPAMTPIDMRCLQGARHRVSNVRGYAVNTVPEHTFALILALRRGSIGFRQDVIDGRWQEAQPILLLHPSDRRSCRLDARHHRRRRARPGRRPARPGLRHAHAVRGSQERDAGSDRSIRRSTRCWRPRMSSPCIRR